MSKKFFLKYNLRAINYEINQVQSPNSIDRDPWASNDDFEDKSTEPNSDDSVIEFSEKSDDKDNV